MKRPDEEACRSKQGRNGVDIGLGLHGWQCYQFTAWNLRRQLLSLWGRGGSIKHGTDCKRGWRSKLLDTDVVLTNFLPASAPLHRFNQHHEYRSTSLCGLLKYYWQPSIGGLGPISTWVIGGDEFHGWSYC